LFSQGQQIGFSPVITDYSTLSYLCDVVIDPKHRGKGLGKWLIKCILEYPALEGTRVFLATKDSHGLYEKFGFRKHPYDCLTIPPKEPPSEAPAPTS